MLFVPLNCCFLSTFANRSYNPYTCASYSHLIFQPLLFDLVLVEQSRDLGHPLGPVLTEELPLRRQRIRFIQASIKYIRIIPSICSILHDSTPTFVAKFPSKQCPTPIIFLMLLQRPFRDFEPASRDFGCYPTF
jgi:hypothetical protein